MTQETKSDAAKQTNFIHGLRLGGYRSFGTPQVIGPFEKINLFVGPNNAGKSNVLRFLFKHYGVVAGCNHSANARSFDEADFHGREECVINADIATPLDFLLRSAHDAYSGFISSKHITAALENIPQDLRLTDELIMVPRYLGAKNDDLQTRLNPIFAALPDPHPVRAACNGHSGRFCEMFAQMPTKSLEAVNHQPPVIYIPENRTIQRGEPLSDWQSIGFSGQGAIELLAELQSPGTENSSVKAFWKKKDKHKRIEQFVANLLDVKSVIVEANYSRDSIIVGIGDNFQALQSLGSGIQQAILFAIATTYFDNRIFCIEEPEVHMHPDLQRRFINYLSKTENQYFLSSHSAHFIDSECCVVFRVEHTDGETKVSRAISSEHKFEVCKNLGYRASDLLQSNCIVWVEGPSDAIYMRRWLTDFALDLKEGQHFSIMFYGGALRKHLRADGEISRSGDEDDDDIEKSKRKDLIDLLRLNRHLVMIADSDKKSATQIISDEDKTALEHEVNKIGGVHWYTEGLSIENYVREDVITAAKKRLHPRTNSFPVIDSPYRRATTKIQNSDSKEVDVDKVELAKIVCAEAQPFSESTDYRKRINLIVNFIKKCNGLKHDASLFGIKPPSVDADSADTLS